MVQTHVRAETLGGQVAVMMRVIVAVILRESKTRFSRNRLGFMWVLIDPLIYIGGFLLVRFFIGGHVPFGENLALFFITGLIVFRSESAISGHCMHAIAANKALLSYPLVKPFDLIVGRLALDIGVAIFIWVVSFAALEAFSDYQVVYHPSTLVLAFCMTCLLGSCLGFFHSVVSVIFPTWERIWGLFKLPLFMMSGIFYVPTQMPQMAQEILWWNPLLHCVELLRTATYLTYDPLLSIPYLIVFSVLCLVTALTLERAYRHIIMEG